MYMENMLYGVDSHSCVIVFMSIVQSIRGAANQSVCSAQVKMHGLTRPPWLGVARRFELAAPRSLVFFIPLLTEHTRARVLTLTRARASSHSRSYARTRLSLTLTSSRSLFSFSCLSLSTFIWFRMGLEEAAAIFHRQHHYHRPPSLSRSLPPLLPLSSLLSRSLSLVSLSSLSLPPLLLSSLSPLSLSLAHSLSLSSLSLPHLSPPSPLPPPSSPFLLFLPPLQSLSLSLPLPLSLSLSLSLPVYHSSHTLILNTLVDGHCVPQWESHRSSFVAARTFRVICFYKWPCA